MILKYDVDVIKDEEGLNFVFLIDHDNEVVERLVKKFFNTGQVIRIDNVDSLESYPHLYDKYYEFDAYIGFVPTLMPCYDDKIIVIKGYNFSFVLKLADESYFYNLESEEAWDLLENLSTAKIFIKSHDGKIDNPIFTSRLLVNGI